MDEYHYWKMGLSEKELCKHELACQNAEEEGFVPYTREVPTDPNDEVFDESYQPWDRPENHHMSLLVEVLEES